VTDNASNYNVSTQADAVVVSDTVSTSSISSPTSGSPVTNQSGESVPITYSAQDNAFNQTTINITNGSTEVASATFTNNGTSISETLVLGSDLADESYDINVNVTDNASNYNVSTQADAVIVDDTIDTASISSPTSGSPIVNQSNDSVPVTYSAQDAEFNQTTINITNGSTEVASGTFENNATDNSVSLDLDANLTDGTYHLIANVTDNVSNYNVVNESDAVIVNDSVTSVSVAASDTPAKPSDTIAVSGTTSSDADDVTFQITDPNDADTATVTKSISSTSYSVSIDLGSLTFDSGENDGLDAGTATLNAQQEPSYSSADASTTFDVELAAVSDANISSYDGTNTNVTIEFGQAINTSQVVTSDVTFDPDDAGKEASALYGTGDSTDSITAEFSSKLYTGDSPVVEVNGTNITDISTDNATVHTVQLNLSTTGPHFVSVPEQANSIQLSAIDTSNVGTVWRYDDGSWGTWKPGRSQNDFDTLAGGQGYIFNMSSVDTIDVNANNKLEGSLTRGEEQLDDGWNLVGHWQEGSQPENDALANVSNLNSSTGSVVGQKTAGSLTFQTINASQDPNPDDLNPGEAYFINHNGTGTYNRSTNWP
jgi:hypothetical protein